MDAFETNFDGLVGPTHNYAGLSFGNLASERHRTRPSNPRLAARQGLAKTAGWRSSSTAATLSTLPGPILNARRP